MAKAIFMPTTSRTKSPTWIACPTHCADELTIAQHRKAAKSCWPSAWKRFVASAQPNMVHADPIFMRFYPAGTTPYTESDRFLHLTFKPLRTFEREGKRCS